MLPPIAIQTFWRTGGTYLWEKFRSLSQFCAYYEPLHGILWNGTAAAFEAEFQQGLVSRLRHPTLSRHYFAEYPIEPAGGVRHFEKRFPLGRYVLDDTDEDAGLSTYLQYLISHALGQGRRPVFKFCRMGLRQRWFKHHFGAATVLVVRNFGDTFRSCLAMQERSVHFLKTMIQIVIRNRDTPRFAPLAALLRVESEAAATEAEIYRLQDAAYKRASLQELRDLAFFLWATHSLQGLSIADEVFDLDRVAGEPAEREHAAEALGRRFSASFDFRDARAGDGPGCEPITAAARMMTRDAIHGHGPAPTAASLAQLFRPTQDLLAPLL